MCPSNLGNLSPPQLIILAPQSLSLDCKLFPTYLSQKASTFLIQLHTPICLAARQIKCRTIDDNGSHLKIKEEIDGVNRTNAFLSSPFRSIEVIRPATIYLCPKATLRGV
nr:hypothetical protein Iba_chr08dCG11160 [Ipomoea batatas]